MKLSGHTKQQKGAVLAFSLVMLLLLTLVSISMIKQNKTQINIASNAGQQVQAFATVETALRQAQGILEPMRYVDEVGDQDKDGIANEAGRAYKHCQSGVANSVHEGDVLYGLPENITAKVVGVYCLSNYSNKGTAANPSWSGDEARCFYNGPNRNLVVGTPTTNAAKNVDACNKLNDPRGWSDGNAKPNACQIEIYVLNVNIKDAITQADRTVETKFQVDCSNDLIAHNCTSGVAPCPVF